MLCLFIFNFWPHPVAYGILVPRSGMEPSLPALESKVLTARELPQLLNFNFGFDSFNSQRFVILFTLQPGCVLLNHFKTVGYAVDAWTALVQLPGSIYKWIFFFVVSNHRSQGWPTISFTLIFNHRESRHSNPCVGQKSTISKLYGETTFTCCVCCFPCGCFPQPFVDDCWFVGFPWWFRQWGIHLQCGDLCLIPRLGISPGGGHGNPLQ